MHTYIYIYMYMCMSIYTYKTYIYIYIHTCMWAAWRPDGRQRRKYSLSLRFNFCAAAGRPIITLFVSLEM